MQLSDRLKGVVNLVSDTDCGADVGCDHGFISIELIHRKVAGRMIAMDVREGPLMRAKEHIISRGLTDRIETRLSDGVEKLGIREADSAIIAGMGGNLVLHILENGKDIIKDMRQCILQPQSEIEKVRRYLRENNFKTVAEDMIFEDGKYYPMMKVIPGKGESREGSRVFDCYGEMLLKDKNPVLKKFLIHQLKIKNEILDNLMSQKDKHSNRIKEIELDKAILLEALDYVQ